MNGCNFDPEKHIYSINGRPVPGVTDVLKVNGFEPYGSEWHMAKGKAVHLACQYLDEGGLDYSSVSDEILPYLMAYELFKKESGFKPTRIEETLFSTTFCYGGTLDREGTFDGGKNHVVIDFKSGAISPWTGLQLAGYDLLLPALKYPRERYGLQLKPNGRYDLKQFKDGQDKNVFLSMLSIYHWRNNKGLIKTEE